MPETYKMKVDCSNCDLFEKEIEIPKGAMADEVPCPECGNMTLAKHRNVVIG